MTRSKSTKRAMCTSIFSVLVCSAMLLGSTYAWFSSTANSGDNKIVAGNLKVALEYKDGAEWKDAKDRNLFEKDKDFLWEPGAMLISDEFHVTNEGNLALQYAISLDVGKQTLTKDGKSLTDVIEMKVVNADDSALTGLKDDATQGDRASAWDSFTTAAAGKPTNSGVILPETAVAGPGEDAGETKSKVVVLYWKPTETDNDYNVEPGDDPLDITFGVNVFATQTPSEEDSFGKYYDDGIPVTKASYDINGAVGASVGHVNSTLEANPDTEGKISFSALNYDPVNDKYVSTVTFTTTDSDSITAGAAAVAGLINEAVEAQKANIATITIGGHEADLTQSSWLLNPLLQWLDDIGGGTGKIQDGAEALKKGGQSCDVVITDKDGFAVTYNLAFVFDVD